MKPNLSAFSGFFGKSLDQRREIIRSHNEANGIKICEDEQSKDTLESLSEILDGALTPDSANKMIENQIGLLQVPVGICPYMYMNGKHYVVPMATEEPSVIAAVSSISKLAFDQGVTFDVTAGAAQSESAPVGGFHAISSDNVMTTQIQLLFDANEGTTDLSGHETALQAAKLAVQAQASSLMAAADALCPGMVKRGGGTRALRVEIMRPKRYELSVARALEHYLSEMGSDSAPVPAADAEPAQEQADETDLASLVLYLSVDVCDSMGANLLNTIAEGLAPVAAEAAAAAAAPMGFTPRCSLRILSNLCLDRWVRCGVRWPLPALQWKATEGEAVAERMVAAWRLARDDPMRACTHNKGVMNGVTAAALATGQDTRAVEAALHTYAGTTGRYQPLTELRVRDGFLEATFEGPIAVGTRGGSVRAHPLFAYSLAQLAWPSAKELAMLLGCIGLAQNLAAVRALAIEGIQKGHMRLHNRK